MTEQLAEVLKRARDFGNKIKSVNVIHTLRGKPYGYHGAQTAWRRAVIRARRKYEDQCVVAGVEISATFLANAHFHDLRRKALTDAKNQGKDPQKLAGHADAKMTARYLEQVEIEWIEPPRMAMF